VFREKPLGWESKAVERRALSGELLLPPKSPNLRCRLVQGNDFRSSTIPFDVVATSCGILMPMALSPLAGKPAPKELLIDPTELERQYYTRKPDIADPAQQVSFGTSGHRGSPLKGSFTESHVLAITQAICDYRRAREISGPLFIGRDTHAVSAAAQQTALEVFAGNRVEAVIQQADGVTPTPAISRMILVHNRGRRTQLADGVVITPSHNPPEDGGFKYNPPDGGPADSDVTGWIQARANTLLHAANAEVRRVAAAAARAAATTHEQDFLMPYVEDLRNVVDLAAVRAAGLRMAVDPLGGAAVRYWEPINRTYGLDIIVVNPAIDPTFSFMTVDHDGKIRMDCSSPYAMARLVGLKDQYRVAFANDTDADRHGIVTPTTGLMNPNHYLTVAVDYLLRQRPGWPAASAVGKTLVSSAMIDRVVTGAARALFEAPVGFKWFAPKLLDGSVCFGGEESAGASFLRQDGSVWTTDKDGLIMALLAAEITARTGKDPGEHYQRLSERFGASWYARVDAPATREQKARLATLAPENVRAATLAGEPIATKLTRAPGNDAPIGGLKVTTRNGWFAARPSGTEDLYKIYAESFKDERHLAAILAEAQAIVSESLTSA
jgi:phosphoglucomutase